MWMNKLEWWSYKKQKQLHDRFHSWIILSSGPGIVMYQMKPSNIFISCCSWVYWIYYFLFEYITDVDNKKRYGSAVKMTLKLIFPVVLRKVEHPTSHGRLFIKQADYKVCVHTLLHLVEYTIVYTLLILTEVYRLFIITFVNTMR